VRVLVVASPLIGHVLPLVPLALALREAGADVAVATAGDGVAVCPPELSPTDVAPGLRLGPLFGRIVLRHPRLARRELAGRGGTAAVGLLFGTLGARTADGVLALADRWRPDLVVHEPLAPAGVEAAARLGIPAVLVEGNLFDAARLRAAALAVHAPARGLRGLPAPAETVTTAPPSLVGAREGRPMRFVPWAPERPFDEGYARPGPRPRVLVSRSTVSSPGRDRLMADVAAAAAGTDLDVVLVRPERWVTRRRLRRRSRRRTGCRSRGCCPPPRPWCTTVAPGRCSPPSPPVCRNWSSAARVTAAPTPTWWPRAVPASRSMPAGSPRRTCGA
jgi:hypothetical protein